VIKHKKGKSNVVADALSRRYALFTSLETKFIGFEHIKELYKHDSDFSHIYHSCALAAQNDFFRHNGYLLKDKRLCVPKSSIRELLVKRHMTGA